MSNQSTGGSGTGRKQIEELTTAPSSFGGAVTKINEVVRAVNATAHLGKLRASVPLKIVGAEENATLSIDFPALKKSLDAMGGSGGGGGTTIATLMCVNGTPVTYNLVYV